MQGTMPGARRRGRPRTAWVDNIKAWTGLSVGRVSQNDRGNSLRQTVHTHCASVQQAAKLVAALHHATCIKGCLAESNGSLPPGL